MIQINKTINVEDVQEDYYINVDGKNVLCSEVCEKGIFLDLEHYVYKKPIGIVVFGACTYDSRKKGLKFIQFMMENKEEKRIVLSQAEEFFRYMYEFEDKRYIITFSGNNDFLVMKHLFNEEKFDFRKIKRFGHVDIQKEYEKAKKKIIGLKKLENYMGIERQGEVLNGAKMARTFGKMFSRANYRLNVLKKDKLLEYNQQDVLSLYYILNKWDEMIINKKIDERILEIEERKQRELEQIESKTSEIRE